MTTLNLQQLRSDKRRKEHVCWHKWMSAAADLASRFYDDAGEDDPFGYNETASVGFLATAAAQVGFLALPEFTIRKIDSADRRKSKRGRSDLWVQADPALEWWFEFKHHHIFRGSDRDLERRWHDAMSCAQAVKNHGVCVAGLIVSFSWLKEQHPKRFEAAKDAMVRFVSKRQFAWRMSGDDVGPETYICLEIARQN